MANIKIVSASGASTTAQAGPVGMNVNAEDVLDLIVDISPHETAVVSLLPKVQASSTTHEWITDSLPTALANHTIAEGADYGVVIGTNTADSDTDNRLRQKNFLQHFRRSVQVTNLQRVMNPFGIADEYSYQVGRSSKLLGCDLEKMLLQDQVVQTGTTLGTSTDPATMKSLCQLIAEENTGALGTRTTSRCFWAGDMLSKNLSSDRQVLTSLTTATAITEGKIVKVVEKLIGTDTLGGGNPDTLIVNPATFGHIGAFGAAVVAALGSPAYVALTMNTDPALKRIIRAVRFYESQYGVLQVVMSRFCPQALNTTMAQDNNGMAYFIERNRFRIAFGRPFQHVPLPPNGDSTRGMVLGDVTCELLDARSAAYIFGVSPTV